MSNLSSMDVVVHLLCIDPESGEYVFSAGASETIALLLEAIFALDEPQRELDELIKLSCVLELELRSPSAAALLRATLLADPRFVKALGPAELFEGFAANPALARWSGAEDVKSAPMHGAERPDGTLKAGSLVSVVPPHIAKQRAKSRHAKAVHRS
jgi:hypothetical protein